MFGHAAVGNKSLGESVVDFTLAGDISSPSAIFLKIEIAFATDGKNIRLPVTEVLLHAAAGNLARSKNQRVWNPISAVLISTNALSVFILHCHLNRLGNKNLR